MYFRFALYGLYVMWCSKTSANVEKKVTITDQFLDPKTTNGKLENEKNSYARHFFNRGKLWSFIYLYEMLGKRAI